jgi:hypothetical protein
MALMSGSLDYPSPDPAFDPAWCLIGRVAGYGAAGAILVTTALFLADAANMLVPAVSFQSTGAGSEADLATYFVAFFARQHAILWDIALRDTIGPLGYLALVVLFLAVLNLVGPRRAAAQLMALFVLVGSLLAALNSLTFLAQIEYWRFTDWSPDPATNMIAVGRAADAITKLTVYPEVAGILVLGAGLLAFGRLCHTDRRLPARLGLLAYAESVALVGIAVAAAAHLRVVYAVLALVAGVVIAPAIGLWLGTFFGRVGESLPSVTVGRR